MGLIGKSAMTHSKRMQEQREKQKRGLPRLFHFTWCNACQGKERKDRKKERNDP